MTNCDSLGKLPTGIGPFPNILSVHLEETISLRHHVSLRASVLVRIGAFYLRYKNL